MNYFNILFPSLLILVLLQEAKGCSPTSPTRKPKPAPIRCGGVLQESTGGISYKPYKSVSRNERCIWTIQTGDTKGYILNVSRLGSKDGSEVIATCFWTGFRTQSQIIYATGKYNFTEQCSVLVITFHTTNFPQLSSKGFILEYESKSGTALIGKHLVMNDGDIEHPVTYSVDIFVEFSTFTLVPRNNEFAPGQTTSMTLQNIQLIAENCRQTFVIYNFISGTGTWAIVGTVLAEANSVTFTCSGEPIIVAFINSWCKTGAGFRLIMSAS